VFRVTRNADLERNEEEAEDLLELIEGELKERRFSEIVRMEIDIDTPSDIRAFLKQELGVKEEDIYDMRGPIGLVDVHELANLQGFDALRHPLWTPALHPILRPRPDEPAPDLFEAIRKGFIVHHPYHSFESTTQRFVELAAADPDVLAIKQTLYRTSSDSPLMHALIRAADAGKQVAVLVELKARFDEQQNITWAQKLEKAGVHVSYGIAGLKIHCKLTMVVREEQEGLRRYVHIGTGNYHPKTAQLYEDFGLFTCDEAIAADVTDLFNMLTGYARTQTYRRLMVAPTHMRREMERLILREMDHARKGRKAGIIAKMNALEDPGIIRLLYEASQEGVEIDLIVRGVCRLVPGIPGLSERIRVRSVIGRFLEHSRCYVFENGGDPDYFIGSADWMHRNLDARVEALAPVTDDALKAYLSFCLDTYLSDNRQSWVLGPDALYTHLQPSPDEPSSSCHAVFMQAASQRL
jgi:polyphosphate kinase